MVRSTSSQGSRNAAHNLDEQFERWRIRREEIIERNQIAQPAADIAIRDFLPELEYRHVGEALSLQAALIERRDFIAESLTSIANERRSLPSGMTYAVAMKKGLLLKGERELMFEAAKKRCHHQLERIRRYIKENASQPAARPKHSRRPLFVRFPVHPDTPQAGIDIDEAVNVFMDDYDQDISLAQWAITETGILVQFWVESNEEES